MISSDLSWSIHISLTCCKAKRFLRFLYRNFRDGDFSCLSHLHKALVCLSWSTAAACGTPTRFIIKKCWSMCKALQPFWLPGNGPKMLLLCVGSSLGHHLPQEYHTINLVCAAVSSLTVPSTVSVPLPLPSCHHMNSCPLPYASTNFIPLHIFPRMQYTFRIYY